MPLIQAANRYGFSNRARHPARKRITTYLPSAPFSMFAD
jgi:hypothetical protein